MHCLRYYKQSTAIVSIVSESVRCEKISPNVDMTQFVINRRTDTNKTGVNLVLTITRPQNGQMPGIIEGKDTVSSP